MNWVALFTLFGLTALLLLLPLLPALREWRWPRDVTPLHIDGDDTLDPPVLARHFIAGLQRALAEGLPRLGASELAALPTQGPWALNADEQKRRASRRVWHALDNPATAIHLPADVDFLGELAAAGDLHTAARTHCRALWAGATLHLAEACTVTRWAHAQRVQVAPGARLAGRVSAEQQITLNGPLDFTLLHAPTVSFLPVALRHARAVLPALVQPWPPAVFWDAAARRGVVDGDLDLAARQAHEGDLLCRGHLRVGEDCRLLGGLKAQGELHLGAGCRVQGALVAPGRIVLGPDCRVLGPVVSETEVELAEGCTIGAPGRPSTVTAPRLRVAAGVVVHGTLWAGENGVACELFVEAADTLPELRPVLPAPAAGLASGTFGRQGPWQGPRQGPA